jgi:diguanylate cyclase (GGDEF)-like protein/PAS domain S-box-containing protein
MAAGTLRHAGFEVVEADCGEQALIDFSGASFDLVLLDVVMGGADGFEVCRRLRALPQPQPVPIVMLTGLNDSDTIAQAYEAGATDFITKPIQWALLPQRVRYGLRVSAASAAAARSRDSLVRAQRLAHMGNWEFSLHGAMRCSDELARIFGAPADAMQCASPQMFLSRVCVADRARVAEARAAAMRGQPYQLTFSIERFDGSERIVAEHAVPLCDGLGRQIGVEGITQDITERVEAERQIRQLALHDGLTGLPNRQFFLELATPTLERAKRAGALCAVLHLDVDDFKTVNDALGRASGDMLLRIVAERLEQGTRGSDITSVGATARAAEVVARIGANAFTMMLYDIGHPENAASAAARLIRLLQRPISMQGRPVVLGASVGIALYPRDGHSAPELAAHAEQALYAAKKAGRSQQRYYDEAMNVAAQERLARETELRLAIEHDQLRLHFQPKIDAGSGLIVGVEALVRWMHPERGMIPPASFIPLAEETGLIHPLTDWVFNAACRWRLDPGRPARRAGVHQHGQPLLPLAGLVERLSTLVQRHGLQPSMLALEVTESILMDDNEQAASRLHALRDLGFKLSLDDFGTGFSSLSYVKRFPIDELKIDRSFVQDLAAGGKDLALVASIVTLGACWAWWWWPKAWRPKARPRRCWRRAAACTRASCTRRPVAADALVGRLRHGAAHRRLGVEGDGITGRLHHRQVVGAIAHREGRLAGRPRSSATSSSTRRFSAPSTTRPQGRGTSRPVSRPSASSSTLARAKSMPSRCFTRSEKKVKPPLTSSVFRPALRQASMKASTPGLSCSRSSATACSADSGTPASRASLRLRLSLKLVISPRIAASVMAATSDRRPAASAISSMHSIEISVESMSKAASPKSLPMSLLTLYGARFDGPHLLAVAFSQSGQSPDLVEPLRQFGQGGAQSGRRQRHRLAAGRRPRAGCCRCTPAPRRSVAATKSFIAQWVVGLRLVGLAGRRHAGRGAAALPEALQRAAAPTGPRPSTCCGRPTACSSSAAARACRWRWRWR